MKLYIKPCWEYPLHALDITDWLAKEKGLDTQLTGEISIETVKSDAYKIAFRAGASEYYQKYEYWIPRSQCEIVERTGPKK
jgi:hypothetical protein